MKVLLVNPPSFSKNRFVREGRCMQREGAWGYLMAPLSLAYIASTLRDKHHKIKLLDCVAENINRNKLKNVIRKFNPKLIICNTSTPSIEYDLTISSLAKSVNRNIKTAFFGIHVTALTKESFEIDNTIDYIIRYEPEKTSLELVKYLEGNIKLSEVAGISYIDSDFKYENTKHTEQIDMAYSELIKTKIKTNKIIINRDQEFISDLDSLPLPAWDLIDFNKYIIPFKNKKFLLLQISRGCPYSCTFCPTKTFYGSKLRLRNSDAIYDEMVYIKKKYNIDNFLFWTEGFTMNRDLVHSLCKKIINGKLKFSWVCNSRVDTIDLETLKLMKKAGCWMVGYGVESSDENILKQSKKNISVNQIKKAISMTKQVGLEAVGHFILGLPGDTKKTIKKTISFSTKLNLDYAQYYCAVPTPGSTFYNQALRNNWIKRKKWLLFEQNHSVLDYGYLSYKDIEQLRSKAYKKFYFRSKIFINNLKMINSFSSLKNAFRTLKEFLGWF